MSFEDSIHTAETAWAVVVVLLRHYHAAESPQTARRSTDSTYEDWADLVALVEDTLAGAHTVDALTDDQRAAIVRWTSNGENYRAVEAVAWGIDCAAHPSFARAWRQERTLGGGGTYKLKVGDIYPVPEADWPWIPDSALVSRPASLTTTKVGELPHVRVHDGSPFDVVFDFGVDGELEHLLSTLTHVASAHPNDDTTEIDYPRHTPAVVFPITPANTKMQAEFIDGLLDLSLAREADAPSILVIPELATTADLAQAIAERVTDEPGFCLVIAGSWHEGPVESARNVSVGVLPEYGAVLRHSKIFPLTAELKTKERSWKEGIVTPERGLITVYTGDRYRLTLLICKDFLDSTLASSLVRLAVNVLLVPAMSPKTHAYVARVAAHAVDSQALSLVAVGPLRWAGEDVGPVAVLGRPWGGREALPVFREDGVRAPSLIRFALKTGDIRAEGYH